MLCSRRSSAVKPTERAMRILAVGDSYMPAATSGRRSPTLARAHRVRYLRRRRGASRSSRSSPSELGLREFQGSPAELDRAHAGRRGPRRARRAGHRRACSTPPPSLRLVCCARGGPVNVDVEAVSARGLPLVNTPGKNAEAVADLTLAFLVMLARGLPKAQRFLEDGGQLRDNLGGRAVHRAATSAATRSGSSVTARSAGGWRCGRARSACACSSTTRYVERRPTRRAGRRRSTSCSRGSDFVSLHARATRRQREPDRRRARCRADEAGRVPHQHRARDAGRRGCARRGARVAAASAAPRSTSSTPAPAGPPPPAAPRERRPDAAHRRRHPRDAAAGRRDDRGRDRALRRRRAARSTSSTAPRSAAVSDELLLAIDAGTGSCRAVLFTLDGAQVAIGQREYSHRRACPASPARRCSTPTRTGG